MEGTRVGSVWVTDGPTILAPGTLAQIERALAAGPIFGRHHHYAGGGSADQWAFRTFEAFQSYVFRSRPGDLYQIWSLRDLLDRNVALLCVIIGPNRDAQTSLALDKGLQA